MDLIGIPHRIVLNETGLDAGTLEYKHRSTSESQTIQPDELIPLLKRASKKTL
jgi:prolyl-tRNA synthetase